MCIHNLAKVLGLRHLLRCLCVSVLHVPSLALTTCDTECVPVNFRLDNTVINGCCRYGDCVCVHHINVSFLLCMFIKLYIYIC